MMIEHLTESQLLTLASGQQADATWLAHADECDICRGKLEDYRATWRVLGQWQAPETTGQPGDAWLHELHRRLEQQSSFVHKLMPVFMRAAAVILVAAGLGVGIAWISTPSADAEQLAAHALQLDLVSANRSLDLESALGVPAGAEVQP